MPHIVPPPLYGIWLGMRQRCYTKTNWAFHCYGGRGITICERWQSYRLFEQDMLPRPSPQHSIDRIDNDGPYSPENCRWATRSEQALNRRDALWVTIEGARHRVRNLAKMTGMKPDTIVARAASGLCYEDVISSKKRRDLSGLALGAAAKSKKAATQTHCAKGHEFTKPNTYFTKEGWKRCRICHNAKIRRYTAMRRELPGP
jgi:hypothetical protein